MADAIQSPTQATFWFIQGRVLFWIINLLGTAWFAHNVAQSKAPAPRAPGDVLVHPRASPVLDYQSAGHGVLRVHRCQTHGAAPARPARHSIRPPLHPARQAFAVLVRAVAASP